MRTTHVLAVLCVLLSASPIPAQSSNPFVELPTELLAGTWLTRNCGVDDEPLLEVAVARRGVELEPLFLAAWEGGPPEAQTRTTREAAVARYQRNREAIRDAEGLGLSPEDLERARERTEEQYVERALRSAEVLYREQALRGLYLTGGEQGRRIVEEVAQDPDSEFNAAAKRLLARDDG